jgi:molybdopterin synthase sulfur carrier subunit
VHPVKVCLPPALRGRARDRRFVEAPSGTVRQVIAALDDAYPGLGFNICHETGELRPYVNLFVDRENIRYLQGLDTLVAPGATIHVLHSVAGG